MRILAAVSIIAVFFFLGQFRFLSIAGVNPNLLLVGLLFFAVKSDKFRLPGVLLAFSIILVFLFDSAWFLEVAAVLPVAALFYFLKSFMSGSRFLDFLAGIAVGTFLLYLLVNPFSFGLPYALISLEVLYNLTAGILLWVVFERLFAARRVL